MLRISRSALKTVVLLSITLACGIVIFVCSVVVRGRSLTLLPWQPSTIGTQVTALYCQLNQYVRQILKSISSPAISRSFHLYRYTPDKPKPVIQTPAAVTLPSISSAEIQPCKNDTICKENLLPDIDLKAVLC